MSAVKLVGKLAWPRDQLRPSFLIRVLHQEQMDLFEHGFAALLHLDIGAIRYILYGDWPVLTCFGLSSAAGIDRAVRL